VAFDSEDQAIHRAHDRMTTATVKMLHYLEAGQFDDVLQEKLWKELQASREELWRLVDERKLRKPPDNECSNHL